MRGICICCRASVSSFSLEEVASVQPLPSAAPALVVRSAQRYCQNLGEIAAMIELLDRVQPGLNLRRDA